MDMPAFETRAEQAYVGRRAVMAMRDFSERIPALMDEVARWLADRGIAASGKPFLRYHVIDMPERMDVEAAFPVEPAGGLAFETLPAGRYATLTYTNVADGIPANARLLDWIAGQGAAIDAHPTDAGDAFAGRIETVLDEAEPDPATWRIEVAIKVRD